MHHVAYNVYMKVKVLVAQSCLTLCDPMDCSPPSYSVHGILQARILQWLAISCFRGFSWSRGWTQVSCTAGRFFTIWAIGVAQCIYNTHSLYIICIWYAYCIHNHHLPFILKQLNTDNFSGPGRNYSWEKLVWILIYLRYTLGVSLSNTYFPEIIKVNGL